MIIEFSFVICHNSGEMNADLPNIGVPATRALTNIGIASLTQVAGKTEEELVALHGVGSKAIRILRAALREQGLEFVKKK